MNLNWIYEGFMVVAVPKWFQWCKNWTISCSKLMWKWMNLFLIKKIFQNTGLVFIFWTVFWNYLSEERFIWIIILMALLRNLISNCYLQSLLISFTICFSSLCSSFCCNTFLVVAVHPYAELIPINTKTEKAKFWYAVSNGGTVYLLHLLLELVLSMN